MPKNAERRSALVKKCPLGSPIRQGPTKAARVGESPGMVDDGFEGPAARPMLAAVPGWPERLQGEVGAAAGLAGPGAGEVAAAVGAPVVGAAAGSAAASAAVLPGGGVGGVAFGGFRPAENPPIAPGAYTYPPGFNPKGAWGASFNSSVPAQESPDAPWNHNYGPYPSGPWNSKGGPNVQTDGKGGASIDNVLAEVRAGNANVQRNFQALQDQFAAL